MERSSPSRTAGVVLREVTLGGVKYLLSQPDKVRKAADEEAFIISRRQIPAGLTGEDRKDAIANMLSGIATTQEWDAYWRSLWRMAFRFWNALDPKHKTDPNDRSISPRKLTLLEGVQWAYEVINTLTRQEMDELWLAIEVVSQEEALKNSSGSPQGDTPKTENQCTVGIPPSTLSSPSGG